MNNKPWAYVTSAWSVARSKAKRVAKKYCKKLSETILTDIEMTNHFYKESSTMRGVLGVDKSKKIE